MFPPTFFYDNVACDECVIAIQNEKVKKCNYCTRPVLLKLFNNNAKTCNYCKIKRKIYTDKNKDKINARNKEKVKCEICNSVVCKKYLIRHQKTKKCREYIKPIPTPIVQVDIESDSDSDNGGGYQEYMTYLHQTYGSENYYI